MFNSRLLILILGTPVTALAQQRQVVMPADSLVPGTYQVRICRAPCDPANDSGLLVKGTVVLLAHGVPRHLLPSTPHEDYYHRFRNACFFLEVVRNDDDTYAGVFAVGMTGWGRDAKDSLVQFGVYWSPD